VLNAKDVCVTNVDPRQEAAMPQPDWDSARMEFPTQRATLRNPECGEGLFLLPLVVEGAGSRNEGIAATIANQDAPISP
jgi:hypothetical protein